MSGVSLIVANGVSATITTATQFNIPDNPVPVADLIGLLIVETLKKQLSEEDTAKSSLPAGQYVLSLSATIVEVGKE